MRHPTLLNDIIFKIVFGTEQNEPVLRALLNALLKLQGEARIHSLSIINPYLEKDYFHDRGVILDVKARDGLGRLYNIEVQVAAEVDYVKRSLYYLARLFGEQLEAGDPYSQIARTIGISLLDFPLFPKMEDLHSTFRFYDEAHGLELSDILEIHYIELPKFKRKKPQGLRTPFERWLHLVRFADLYEAGLESLPESLRKEEGIEQALTAMHKAYANREVRELIEMREKALHDEASRLERAGQEGETRRALRVARNLLEEGMSAERVAVLTGLLVDEVKALAQQEAQQGS